MAKQSITNVATKIVDLLTPLNSEERQRVVQGALTLLGEGQIALPQKAGLESDKDSAEQIEGISPRANVWLRQNGLTLNNLEQVFHIDDGKIELIASEIPGKDNKAKTLNIYILAGVSQFLLSGDASFDDKTARTSCKNIGCYNSANHAVYLGDRGNKMTGSKDQGWKLTVPGLTSGALLIKEITKGA